MLEALLVPGIPAYPRLHRKRQDRSVTPEVAGSIAARLGLAKAIVRTHIRAILEAFGSDSQLEAVAEARRRGILRGDRSG